MTKPFDGLRCSEPARRFSSATIHRSPVPRLHAWRSQFASIRSEIWSLNGAHNQTRLMLVPNVFDLVRNHPTLAQTWMYVQQATSSNSHPACWRT